MNDGNTATNISPITENEMSMFRNLVDRMFSAIPRAQELEARLNSLTEGFENLERSFKALQERNTTLDELLASTRKQRDEYQAELREQVRKADGLDAEVRRLNARVADDEHVINTLRENNASLRNERDKYGEEALHLQEENEKLRAKLAEAHAWAQSIADMFPKPPVPADPPGYATTGRMENTSHVQEVPKTEENMHHAGEHPSSYSGTEDRYQNPAPVQSSTSDAGPSVSDTSTQTGHTDQPVQQGHPDGDSPYKPF